MCIQCVFNEYSMCIQCTFNFYSMFNNIPVIWLMQTYSLPYPKSRDAIASKNGANFRVFRTCKPGVSHYISVLVTPKDKSVFPRDFNTIH